jgi:hypothetical protein
MSVDLGWPPLCIGVDGDAPELPGAWQAQLLDAITSGASTAGISPLDVERRAVAGDRLEVLRVPAAERAHSICIVACSAPLLPQQLVRLCDLDDSGLTLAFATGNRVTRQKNARAQRLTAVSESRLDDLVDALAGMLAARAR